jgi:hypothetical protein
MKTITIGILIVVICYFYFQKNKYIELPEITENLENVHIFNSIDDEHDIF